MALPPERITVKRRRDEDPIEALFIQPKKYRPSAIWKLADNVNDKPEYADLAASSKSFGELQPSQPSDPNAPLIRTTLSSEDVSKLSSAPERASMPSSTNDHPAHTSIARPVRRSQQDKRPAVEPRRFHLTKSTMPITSPYVISKTPAQRQRKGRQHNLAVFVENTGKLRKANPTGRDLKLGVGSITVMLHEEEDNTAEPEVVRKRPNATPAERKWRAENWAKPGENPTSTRPGTQPKNDVTAPSHQWDYESPEIAEHLQKIALEEIRAHEERSGHPLSHPQLKFKPKPPKSRRPAIESSAPLSEEDEFMTDVVALDDNDFVFDTYVRSHANTAGSTGALEPLADPLQGLSRLSMGILIIEEGEDEELWETFGEDFDSDPDLNSEEEDENAEDFYGNDYPEDELNSEDEFGRDAYSYRHYASDDEEFDQEEPTWSDDETDTRRPFAIDRK